jgi:hypothetical protein
MRGDAAILWEMALFQGRNPRAGRILEDISTTFLDLTTQSGPFDPDTSGVSLPYASSCLDRERMGIHYRIFSVTGYPSPHAHSAGEHS